MNSRPLNFHTISIFVLFLLLFTGCRHDVFEPDGDQIVGSGKIVSEQRAVPEYSGILVNGSADVIITQDPNQSLRVEADDNIINRVRTRVQAGSLIVELESGSYHNTTVRIHASMKAIHVLECAGAADFSVTGPIATDAIECRISGAGHYELHGTADEQTIFISGAGEVHNFGLTTKNSTVAISGTGSVEVHASDRLDATISGTGSIAYAGSPRTVHQSIQGLGSIEPRP